MLFNIGSKLTEKELERKVVDILIPEDDEDDENGEEIKWVDFVPKKHCTVGQGDPSMEYKRGGKITSVKWGQLKLLLTEIQFLTIYWDPIKYPNPQVVYVGAAKGTHFVALAKMFPMIMFNLYDREQFSELLDDLPNIKMYNKYFDEKDVAKWTDVQKEDGNVYFISDIRSLKYKSTKRITEKDQIKNEEMVRLDMNMQSDWIKTIKPVKSYLKFRLPYTYDFITKEKDYELYLDGFLYINPFGGNKTTECRMVPCDDLSMRKWNFELHQNQMFYHNVVTRGKNVRFNNFINPDEPNSEFSPELGLTNDYDSASAIYIFKSYLKKINIKPTREKILEIAEFAITRTNVNVRLTTKRKNANKYSN